MTPEVLAGLAAAALALAGLTAWQLRRLRGRLAALERRLGQVREDLDAVGAGGLDALGRLDRAEPALAALADRLGLVESRADGGAYDRAIAAARAGASAADLQRNHGLNPAEAGLIVAVHGRRP